MSHRLEDTKCLILLFMTTFFVSFMDLIVFNDPLWFIMTITLGIFAVIFIIEERINKSKTNKERRVSKEEKRAERLRRKKIKRGDF